jgi:nitric oxide synthase-interacting protein
LFDKEAILQYIITKKNEYSRKLKEFEKQKKTDEQELAEIMEAENKKKLEKFVNTEKSINVGSNNRNDQPGTSGISNMINGNDKQLPSFWVPSQTPQAKKAKMDKPDSTVYCPVSGKQLKAKDLITVKFTLVNDPDDKKSLILKENRYMCPITHDILSNSVPCAVIRTTGDVVTMECVEKIIKKDWIHPLTNAKLQEKDIIELQRGATGFSSVNDNLECKKARPNLQA